jgi:hypothetical protein
MTNTLQYIVLSIITVILLGLGYFLFFHTNSDQAEANAIVAEQLLIKTRVFIERRAQLETVAINQAIFSDPRLTSLRTYTTPGENPPLGRSTLFDFTAEVAE